MKCQPRPPTGRSFQSESTSAGATEPGVKLRPWSRMVTRSVSSVASQLIAMVIFYVVVSLWFHFYRYRYVRRGDQFTMPWPKPQGY